MTSMTVQAMRDYVRNVLDVDSTELPDSLLDVWRNEGTSRVERAFEPWSFYAKSWAFTAATNEVAFSSIGSDVDKILSVEAANWLLKFIPHERAVAKYAWSDQAGALTTEWSVFGSSLFLWPAPNTSTAFTARGYRSPTDASAATDEVDLPDEFHPLVAEWILARAYERDDDDVMSNQKFGRFEQQLEGARRRYLRAPSAGVQVLGGSCDYDGGAPMPSRLAYDWE